MGDLTHYSLQHTASLNIHRGIIMNKLITALAFEYAAYEAKPTKACSKRIRDLLNQIQKTAVAEKKALIAADAAGY